VFLSVFDLFKIGLGPSSSHTMGPMVAAARFLEVLRSNGAAATAQIKVTLHGSLAHTGIGHGTDRAVILGLCGEKPDAVNIEHADDLVALVKSDKRVRPLPGQSYRFDPATDLVFDRKNRLPGHANGMTFEALSAGGRSLHRIEYFSIGGGFVLDSRELAASEKGPVEDSGETTGHAAGSSVPYPFAKAASMLAMARTSGLSIAEMKRQNEEQHLERGQLNARLDNIWRAMDACIQRGLDRDGVMPGGLKVKRRARAIHDTLVAEWKNNRPNPLLANDWLSVYAMAVNEENAAGGRVVTAPTNGAAGVIPAVIKYFLRFHPGSSQSDVRTFLLTAAAIGGILKHNASISGAEVGCQGEVGSASAMAAAGLAAVLGGTASQVENAAEIALEHHLGMTCDPVGGLVQVPCIERNAMGAVKAVTAASLALKGDGTHFVPLDAAIETMRQTGRDMHERYKETSLGGLAVNVVAC
jgi:L-serine dehydratase